MSGFGAALGRGLSTAGYAAGELFAKQSLMEQQSEAELQRAMRLAEIKDQMEQRTEARADERKRAPMKRLQGLMEAEAGTEVPVEADPVSMLSGAGAPSYSDGEQSKGLRGDPKALIAQVNKQLANMPDGPEKEEVRATVTAQLQKQYGAEKQINEAAVAGQTRKRTADEVFDAALSKAKTTDLEAYSAGKPLASERTVTVPDGATVIDRNGKVIFSSAGIKDEREREREDRRDARSRAENEARDRRAEAAEEGRDRRALTRAEVAEARASGKAPSGYRWAKDGVTLEFIPGGPEDPKMKTAGGKPLTDSQSKALLFGARMQASNDILDELEKDGKHYSTPGADGRWGIGAAVNLANTEKGQQLDQAKRDFINAVLRRESGAVIADTEFRNGELQYFPRPGDSLKVIEQKRNNRALATRGILAEVPESARRVDEVRGRVEPNSPFKGFSIKELK